MALAATCLDASAPDLASLPTPCEFPARERDAVTAAATRARALAPVLGGMEDASAIWALLRREGAETVALAGALGAPEQAKRWLDDLRHAKLEITGDDLLAAGLEGPAIGRGLDAATAAMLDGERPATRRSWRRRWRPRHNERVDLPQPFTWADEHVGAALPAGRCCSRPAAAACPRGRSPR